MALLDKISAYWKLDESSGSAIDSTTNGQTLTNNGTVTYGPGKINNAGSFVNASSQFLSRASGTLLQGGNINHTITCWVNLGTTIPSSALVIKSKNSGPDGDYQLIYLGTPNNAFRFGVTGTSQILQSVNASTFGSASPNTQNFIAAWFDTSGSTVNIQINDGVVNIGTITASSNLPVTGTANFQIGAYVDNPNELFLTGQVDEIGWWRSLLTAQERTQLYNGGAGLSYPFTTNTGLQSKIW